MMRPAAPRIAFGGLLFPLLTLCADVEAFDIGAPRGGVPAQSVPPAARATAAASDAGESMGGSAPGTGDGAAERPCRVEAPALGALDRAQAAVYRTLCGTTLWFDGFFGDAAVYESARKTYGRLNVGARWNEQEGTEPVLRLRARVALPAAEQRARVLLGLGAAADIVDGTADSYGEPADRDFDRDEDYELLLGLGYSLSSNPRRGFDLGAGLKLGLPPSPYGGVNYRWYDRLGDDWYLRLRLRGYWYSDEGFGTSFTSSVDYKAVPAWLLRWAAFSKLSETSEGVDWRTRVTAYQRLSDDTALAYSLFARGASARSVPLRDYGVEFRFRRRAFHDWFFIECGIGASWPKDQLGDLRGLNPGASMEFEMQFGKYRPSQSERSAKMHDGPAA